MAITLMSIFRRRAGMSHAAFVDYYETVHRLIGEEVLAGYATRYVRRFTTPLDGEERGDEVDVVLEIDFPTQERMDAFFASVQDPKIAAMIADDEKNLFDSPTMRSYLLDERKSDMPPVP
ncbi:EthD domain-containing protein [Croceicoccus sp. YJ47]|uniref:EthD domain-containing protein n=1 Tax=Croceicoccus sp. YJ47 TaxID=2798724 RepID=UPI00192485E8|nr:EthD domain-containing protein [Croceicoccus sp. YJ47]QQN73423.1 EthD domain-containing protein [Croceicoccus sp. YJ47]